MLVIGSKVKSHVGRDGHVAIQRVLAHTNVHTCLVDPIPSAGGLQKQLGCPKHSRLLGVAGGRVEVFPASGVGGAVHAELSQGGPHRHLGGVGEFSFGQTRQHRVVLQVEAQKSLNAVLGVTIRKGPSRGGRGGVFAGHWQDLIRIVQAVVNAVGRAGKPIICGVGVVPSPESRSGGGDQEIVPHTEGHRAGLRTVSDGSGLGGDATQTKDCAGHQHQS